MDTDGSVAKELRQALADAESSARIACDALLDGLHPSDPRVITLSTLLRDHCRSCPDPFQALDFARLLRALLTSMESSNQDYEDITEWAYAKVRIQSLCSRYARTLREQGLLDHEQALIELAVLHLRHLEESRYYAAILGEMSRILDSTVVSTPISPSQEFLGLARRRYTLPHEPPH